MTHSRRSFLKAGSAAGLATLAARRGLFADAPQSPAVTPRLRQFEYAEVALHDGPLREQFDTNHAFYLALNEDSLLKPFRQRAGMPAPGEDMGGWYDNTTDFNPRGNFHGYIPGHSFGQYLSGLARDYAVTGSKPTRAKVERLVKGFAPTITSKFYDQYHLPAYTFDKTNCGLIDAYQFAGASSALDVLNAATDAVLPHLPKTALSRERQYALPHADEAYCWDEPYTLPENLFLAWQRGAGSRFRDLAVRFLADDWYFSPLANGKNVLPSKHAYSHVNAMSSAMQAYLVMGSEMHLRAAINGFDFLRTTQSYATGGWGPNETFRAPGSGDLGKSLTDTHSSFETPCGAYGHFKITRYLLRVTRDSRYGDSMERVLYNTILGAKHIQKDGHGFYYSDYNNDGSKFYHPDKWTCCTGTFSQITADYGISAYFNDGESIYVNLFVPSRVTWMRGADKTVLTQTTKYPHEPRTQIEMTAVNPDTFPVYLRIPVWAGPRTSVAVNGQRVLHGPEPGRFARIKRTWKKGDRIEVEFDMATTLEAVDPQHPDLVAPVHGPLVLFTLAPAPATVSRKDLLTVRQVAAGSTDWEGETAGRRFALKPFAAIHDEHYRLYLNAKA